MKLFNDQATAAVASLDSADVAYCAKLEQRFAHMGISSKAASSAVQSLVEADAVPQVGICHVPPGVLSHRLSSLAGCQFPTQGSLGVPKRKATPPKSAGSLQVSSSKFR